MRHRFVNTGAATCLLLIAAVSCASAENANAVSANGSVPDTNNPFIPRPQTENRSPHSMDVVALLPQSGINAKDVSIRNAHVGGYIHGIYTPESDICLIIVFDTDKERTRIVEDSYGAAGFSKSSSCAFAHGDIIVISTADLHLLYEFDKKLRPGVTAPFYFRFTDNNGETYRVQSKESAADAFAKMLSGSANSAHNPLTSPNGKQAASVPNLSAATAEVPITTPARSVLGKTAQEASQKNSLEALRTQMPAEIAENPVLREEYILRAARTSFPKVGFAIRSLRGSGPNILIGLLEFLLYYSNEKQQEEMIRGTHDLEAWFGEPDLEPTIGDTTLASIQLSEVEKSKPPHLPDIKSQATVSYIRDFEGKLINFYYVFD